MTDPLVLEIGDDTMEYFILGAFAPTVLEYLTESTTTLDSQTLDADVLDE